VYLSCAATQGRPKPAFDGQMYVEEKAGDESSVLMKTAGNYGSYADTTSFGKQLQSLEFRFCSDARKRRSEFEFCY